MSDESRLERYLAERAGTIDLLPADPGRIVARATRRRQRRRAVSGVVAVCALLGATAGLLAARDDGQQSITLAQPRLGGAPRADALDWSVVRHRSGLGMSQQATITDDGTVYALSTAPGLASKQPMGDGRAVLYRSVDGVSWDTVEMPSDLWASAVASNGHDVYAVGTGPASRSSRALVLNTLGRDDAWAATTLPLDVAAYEDDFPEATIHLDPPVVAAGPSGVVVATVVRATMPFDEIIDQRASVPYDSWYQTGAGATLLRAAGGSCETPPDSLVDLSGGVGSTLCDPGGQLARIVEELTWSELGVSESLRQLVVGKLQVFSSSEGQAFSTVPLERTPAGNLPVSNVEVVADGGGFDLFYAAYRGANRSDVSSLRSSDGVVWEPGTLKAVPGTLLVAGAIGGSPSVLVGGQASESAILYRSARDAGTDSWMPLDLLDAFAVEAADGVAVHLLQPAIGPLGLAALVSVVDEGNGEMQDLWVLHSPDGQSLSTIRVSDYIDLDGEKGYSYQGISVSADAVTVRISDPAPYGGKVVPAQDVLVGVPRD